MSKIIISAAREIEAAPAEIWALLSDYKGEKGHPSILPKPAFKEIVVEEGGQGAGTVFRLTMAVMGQEIKYRMAVTEPEPERVLQETDLVQDLTTTFTCDPISGGQQTRLTIASVIGPSKGFKGFMEKLLNPLVLKPIYKKELENIAGHFREKHSAAGATSGAAK